LTRVVGRVVSPECTNYSTQNASSNDASSELGSSQLISRTFSLVKLFEENFETLRPNISINLLDQVRWIESTNLSLQNFPELSFDSRSSKIDLS